MEIHYQWPEWLAPANSKLLTHLDSIAESRAKLRRIAERGYLHRHVPQSKIWGVLDQALASGAMKSGPGGTTFPGPITLSKDWTLSYLYDLGLPRHQLRQLSACSQLAVVRLLEGFTAGIKNGDLLAPLVCLRSILEHIAHYQHSLGSIRDLPEPKDFKSNTAAIVEVREKILKKIYGTRCDWEKLINLTSDSIEEKSVKYAASENRIDLTSKTMMNAIDSLDKEIPGLRKTYEVLCEFAHPNVGSVLAFMISVKCVSDKATGIDWVEKQFGLEPPRGFTAELSSLLEVIFSKVAAALSRYQSLFEESDIIATKLLALIQSNMRSILSRNPTIIAIYAPCPCGSGQKVKFCCGSKELTKGSGCGC